MSSNRQDFNQLMDQITTPQDSDACVVCGKESDVGVIGLDPSAPDNIGHVHYCDEHYYAVKKGNKSAVR